EPLIARGRGQRTYGPPVAGQQRRIHAVAARGERLRHKAHVRRRAADAVQHEAAHAASLRPRRREKGRGHGVEGVRLVEDRAVKGKAERVHSSVLVWRYTSPEPTVTTRSPGRPFASSQARMSGNVGR